MAPDANDPVPLDLATVDRLDRLRLFLQDEAWPRIPVQARGRAVTKVEREAILGIGPEGV